MAPYLTLLPEDAGQRRHDLRAVFDALRWLMRAGAPWRLLPGDFPPWHAVYDQARRWIAAGVFEAMVHDLRAILRLSQGRTPAPSAAVLDARTLQSTPESGARAGYDGANGRRASGGWRATTSACPRPWPACTWWLSPPSCSPKPSQPSTWSVTPSRPELSNEAAAAAAGVERIFVSNGDAALAPAWCICFRALGLPRLKVRAGREPDTGRCQPKLLS